MDKPLVSALINNYNYGRFLREAIDSALEQTYPHIEVIMVDDGSTDNSREVIESYEDRILPVLKENGGQASAFNVGVRASRGELVCFLDSDDVWLPSKVEEVVRAAFAHPEANLIYHKVQPVSIDKAPLGKSWPNKPLRGRITERAARSGGWWPYPPTSALCFRREFLHEVMSVPEAEFRMGADAYLADTAAFLGDVLGLDEVLSLYRWHASNIYPGWRIQGRDPVPLAERERKMRAELLHYENRVNTLNDALKRIGLSYRVSFRDHLPYRVLKWKLGEGPNIIALSFAALYFPWHTGFVSRVKSLVKLWLDALGLWRR